MPSLGLIKAFLQQATEQGSRSTVLKPLGWLLAILVAGTLTAFYLSTPEWLGILFAILSSVCTILYLVAYVYFGLTDKDALRSETYSIQKLAIEKGFVGDDQHGVIDLSDEKEKKQLADTPNLSEESDK